MRNCITLSATLAGALQIAAPREPVAAGDCFGGLLTRARKENPPYDAAVYPNLTKNPAEVARLLHTNLSDLMRWGIDLYQLPILRDLPKEAFDQLDDLSNEDYVYGQCGFDPETRTKLVYGLLGSRGPKQRFGKTRWMEFTHENVVYGIRFYPMEDKSGFEKVWLQLRKLIPIKERQAKPPEPVQQEIYLVSAQRRNQVISRMQRHDSHSPSQSDKLTETLTADQSIANPSRPIADRLTTNPSGRRLCGPPPLPPPRKTSKLSTSSSQRGLSMRAPPPRRESQGTMSDTNLINSTGSPSAGYESFNRVPEAPYYASAYNTTTHPAAFTPKHQAGPSSVKSPAVYYPPN